MPGLFPLLHPGQPEHTSPAFGDARREDDARQTVRPAGPHELHRRDGPRRRRHAGPAMGVVIGPPMRKGSGLDVVHPHDIALTLMGVAFVLACGTVATLAARFRRPRPRWRIVNRQPGTVAGLSAVAMMLLQVLLLLTRLALPSGGRPQLQWNSQFTPFLHANRLSPFSNIIWSFYSFQDLRYYALPFAAGIVTPCGMAVAGAWLALAISGVWEPERTWIDRTGRALGTLWIMLAVAGFWIV